MANPDQSVEDPQLLGLRVGCFCCCCNFIDVGEIPSFPTKFISTKLGKAPWILFQLIKIGNMFLSFSFHHSVLPKIIFSFTSLFTNTKLLSGNFSQTSIVASEDHSGKSVIREPLQECMQPILSSTHFFFSFFFFF